MVVSSTSSELIKVGAHLDGRNVAHVRSLLNDVIARASADVVLDVSAVDMVDAAGLGMLTAAHLRAEQAGVHLVLHRPSRELRRVLAVTRLSRVLHLDRAGFAAVS